MQLRTRSAFLQTRPLTAAWLLAFSVAGCLTPTQTPPPVPPEPATPRAQPQPAHQPQPPLRSQPGQQQQPQHRPPSIAPAPASVPGRLKVALVSSWLWIDGQYASPLAKLDYLGLFGRLLDHRASTNSVEARTLELEVNPATPGRILQDVLSLVEDADYERVVLVTSSGRFSLCTGSCSASNPARESSTGRRTAVLLRGGGIALWSGELVPEDAPGGADPRLEKLIETGSSGSDAEIEAAVRRDCSKPERCSPVDLYFDEDMPAREVLRVVESIERAVRAAGTTTPLISLGSSPPPLPGDEASVFVTTRVGAGRLPPIVIRQVVRASYGVFRECYRRGLVANPKLEGQVSVRFVIQQDGSVNQVAKGGADLPSEEVIDCVLHGFRALRFPAPRGGNVTVQYPILLVTR